MTTAPPTQKKAAACLPASLAFSLLRPKSLAMKPPVFSSLRVVVVVVGVTAGVTAGVAGADLLAGSSSCEGGFATDPADNKPG